MKSNCKFLLVAKPWRGGLGHYVHRALESLYPGDVFWLVTYPRTFAQKIQYLVDRDAWDRSLIKAINQSDYKAAIFINTRPSFVELAPKCNNILWLTDSPNLSVDMFSRFGPIYVSDTGYSDNVLAGTKPGQFAGELGFAHDPLIHAPSSDPSPQNGGVCFIGNRDQKRDLYLSPLLREHIDLKIVGNYFLNSDLFWKYPLHFRPAVNFSRMGDIYSKHALSLNIHAKVVLNGTNMRTFEAAGYNIAQLVEYRPGIERFFEPGREIEVFSSPEELVAIGQSLLADPWRMKSLASAASKRNAEHTYVNRVKTMLNSIS